MDIKKILASADPKAIEELKEIVNEKDDAKLTQYLDKFLRNFEQRPRKIVESSVCVKYLNKKKEVVAFFNIADFEWIRYKGKREKVIPYSNAIIKLSPNSILGVSKVADCLGNYKILMPSCVRFPISLDKVSIKAIKAKSSPYYGNVARIFQVKAASQVEDLPEVENRVEALEPHLIKDANILYRAENKPAPLAITQDEANELGVQIKGPDSSLEVLNKYLDFNTRSFNDSRTRIEQRSYEKDSGKQITDFS